MSDTPEISDTALIQTLAAWVLIPTISIGTAIGIAYLQHKDEPASSKKDENIYWSKVVNGIIGGVVAVPAVIISQIVILSYDHSRRRRRGLPNFGTTERPEATQNPMYRTADNNRTQSIAPAQYTRIGTANEAAYLAGDLLSWAL